MSFPFVVFAGSSTCFVALIVLLRFLSIKNPMTYKTAHKKISRIGCIVIWCTSFLVPSIAFIFQLPSLFDPVVLTETTSYVIVGIVLGVFPTLLTIISYVASLYALKQKTVSSDQARKTIKSTSRMFGGIVIGLVVCNVPGILFTVVVPNFGTTEYEVKIIEDKTSFKTKCLVLRLEFYFISMK